MVAIPLAYLFQHLVAVCFLVGILSGAAQTYINACPAIDEPPRHGPIVGELLAAEA